MKKKLRDCSQEEIDRYCKKHAYQDCKDCRLRIGEHDCLRVPYVNCKDYLNDKALNIEIDIPQQEILDEEDKETLIYNCLLLKREHVKDITISKSLSWDKRAFFIYISYKDKEIIRYINLPYFTDKNMFANMELEKKYTPQDLGIDLDKYELALKEK
jgi:hypothetical protein